MYSCNVCAWGLRFCCQLGRSSLELLGKHQQTRFHVGVVARWHAQVLRSSCSVTAAAPAHPISFTTMASAPNGTRPNWVSKTAFDSLGVESGEESEEEVLDSPTVPDRCGPYAAAVGILTRLAFVSQRVRGREEAVQICH